jgi:hypothetical protein
MVISKKVNMYGHKFVPYDMSINRKCDDVLWPNHSIESITFFLSKDTSRFKSHQDKIKLKKKFQDTNLTFISSCL